MTPSASPDLIHACLQADLLCAGGAAAEAPLASDRAVALGLQVQEVLKQHGQRVEAALCVQAAHTVLTAVSPSLLSLQLPPTALEENNIWGPLVLKYLLGAALVVTGHQLWNMAGPSLGPLPHLDGAARLAAHGLAELFLGSGWLLMLLSPARAVWGVIHQAPDRVLRWLAKTGR